MARSSICSEGRGFSIPNGGGIYLDAGPLTTPVDEALLASLNEIKVPGANRVFLSRGGAQSRLTEQYLNSMPSLVRQNIVLIWAPPLPGETPDLAEIEQVSRHFQLRVHLANTPGMVIPEGMTGSPALMPVDAEGRETTFEQATGFRVLPERLGPAPEAAPAVPLAPLPPELKQPEGSNFTGRVLTVGKWSGRANTMRMQVHDLANASSRPVFAIGGQLDDNDWRLLNSTASLFGLHNVTPTLVTMTDSEEIRNLARRFAAVTVHLSSTGLDEEHWHVRGPDGTERTFDGKLARSVFAAADEVAVASSWAVPPVLAEWLSQGDYGWPTAEEFFAGHRAELTTPEVSAALNRLIQQDEKDHPLTVDEDGRQKDERNRVLPAFASVLRIAAQQPPGSDDVRIEPTVTKLSRLEPPVTTPLNTRFAFDYLSGRLLPADPDRSGMSRILWDGLLLQTMVGGQLSRADMVALARGVGASRFEVAAAAVFEAITLVLDSAVADPETAKEWIKRAEQLIAQYQCDVEPSERLSWIPRMDDLRRRHRQFDAQLNTLTIILANC